MNNFESNLYEIYEQFYYPSNIDKLLTFLNEKFEKITKQGVKDGLNLDKDAERELIHKLMLEGIPFYINEQLKNKMKQFEESISEQPMLLAYPNAIKKQNLLNFLNPKYISILVNDDYVSIDEKIYPDFKEYEIFNMFKYLYLEGIFEDTSIKNKDLRKDFILNFHKDYFKESKHTEIYNLAQLITHLPYELNLKYSNLALQTNDYIQASYFRENHSYIKQVIDSSFKTDTGRKITVMIVLFPNEVEVKYIYLA
jgi:hypothetical protein